MKSIAPLITPKTSNQVVSYKKNICTDLLFLVKHVLVTLLMIGSISSAYSAEKNPDDISSEVGDAPSYGFEISNINSNNDECTTNISMLEIDTASVVRILLDDEVVWERQDIYNSEKTAIFDISVPLLIVSAVLT